MEYEISTSGRKISPEVAEITILEWTSNRRLTDVWLKLHFNTKDENL